MENDPGAPLEPADTERLRDSWFELETGDADVAAEFYGRLFASAPELRPLFRGDMESQRRKFMSTLSLVVESIDAPQRIAPTVAELGRRHVDYGVAPEHYALVGKVLLETLAECLGDQADDATIGAWRTAYQLLAAAMQDSVEDDGLI